MIAMYSFGVIIIIIIIIIIILLFFSINSYTLFFFFIFYFYRIYLFIYLFPCFLIGCQSLPSYIKARPHLPSNLASNTRMKSCHTHVANTS